MAKLERQIEALATSSPARLRDHWQDLYGSAAPKLSPDLLRMGIAYRMQEQRYGGLSAAVLRRITSREAAPAPIAAPKLSAGAQLIRSWRGRTIIVDVEEGGYRFEDRRYTSLSQIAREVTGAHWSGPRFFGLTSAKVMRGG
ncbi:DUF2924 domain-containing protein [Sphingomonas sp. ID0503]|uniref:DUF2924 domain-containing protein n=1 Tax=Sphingomonas sp. ID0503 TaxID=3399691 RepID=UPI003AFAD6D5